MPAKVSDSQLGPGLVYIFIQIKDFRINMLNIIPYFDGVGMVAYIMIIYGMCFSKLN